VKYLVALDIGITTGVAVYWYGGKDLRGELRYTLEETEVLSPDFLRDGIKRIIRQYMISYSVAELPLIVRGPLGNDLQECVNIVRAELPHQCEWVAPSQWKGTPSSKIKCPRGLTAHERDAIRIGHWYMATRLANL